MEPERDIEKTLRAYAKMRRDEGGVPPELHPAARKLLQAEAAAQRGRKNTTTWAGLLWGTWPRLAFTICSAAAVIVAAGFVLIPEFRSTPENLARNDKDLSLFKNLDEPAKRRDEADKAKQAPTLAAHEFQAPAAAPGAAASSAQSQLASSAPTKKELPTPPVTSSTQAVLPPTLTGNAEQFDAATLAMGERQQVAVVTQQFARVVVPATPGVMYDSSAAPAVLNSFRVEQAGDQLRVIDSDGSIYTGTILRTADALAQSAPAAKAAPQGAAGGGFGGGAPAQNRTKTAVPEYTFRVTGTNVNLRQPVEFSGNFVLNDVPPAAPRPSPIAGGGGGRRGGAAASRTSTNSLANNAPATTISADTNQPLTLRLRGEIVIGTNRVEVDAMPEKK